MSLTTIVKIRNLTTVLQLKDLRGKTLLMLIPFLTHKSSQNPQNFFNWIVFFLGVYWKD